MRDVLGWTDSVLSKFALEEALADSCGYSWWHDNVFVACDRPRELHRNTKGDIHKDGGAAILYPDGWAIHALNGIRMKAEYVETPAERIAPETVLAETNADIRRELIRKVGAERMLSKLPHKVLEKCGNYELLSIRLSDEVRDARYLKMINPSVGCFHVEGVAPECKTVNESLNWRNSQWFENAEALT